MRLLLLIAARLSEVHVHMMEKRHRVILYGSSVFIAGVEANLADRPGSKSIRSKSASPDDVIANVRSRGMPNMRKE